MLTAQTAARRRCGLRRRAPPAPPSCVQPHARCLAPGARTPPGVLAPGASPRVRWSHRGRPQHRKWPWRVCLQILGELKKHWGLVTVGHRRAGVVSTEQSVWGWVGPALPSSSPEPRTALPLRLAVGGFPGSLAATGECLLSPCSGDPPDPSGQLGEGLAASSESSLPILPWDYPYLRRGLRSSGCRWHLWLWWRVPFLRILSSLGLLGVPGDPFSWLVSLEKSLVGKTCLSLFLRFFERFSPEFVHAPAPYPHPWKTSKALKWDLFLHFVRYILLRMFFTLAPGILWEAFGPFALEFVPLKNMYSLQTFVSYRVVYGDEARDKRGSLSALQWIVSALI